MMSSAVVWRYILEATQPPSLPQTQCENAALGLQQGENDVFHARKNGTNMTCKIEPAETHNYDGWQHIKTDTQS